MTDLALALIRLSLPVKYIGESVVVKKVHEESFMFQIPNAGIEGEVGCCRQVS
jgi:hypothetical protein